MNGEQKGVDRINVSREVIADLACRAVMEVEGVVSCVKPAAEGITSRVRKTHYHHGVGVTEEKDGLVSIDIHLKVKFGASLPQLAREVKQRVSEFLARMTETRIGAVDIFIDDIEAPV